MIEYRVHQQCTRVKLKLSCEAKVSSTMCTVFVLLRTARILSIRSCLASCIILSRSWHLGLAVCVWVCVCARAAPRPPRAVGPGPAARGRGRGRRGLYS